MVTEITQSMRDLTIDAQNEPIQRIGLQLDSTMYKAMDTIFSVLETHFPENICKNIYNYTELPLDLSAVRLRDAEDQQTLHSILDGLETTNPTQVLYLGDYDYQNSTGLPATKNLKLFKYEVIQRFHHLTAVSVANPSQGCIRLPYEFFDSLRQTQSRGTLTYLDLSGRSFCNRDGFQLISSSCPQ